jgi:hypothetical protein
MLFGLLFSVIAASSDPVSMPASAAVSQPASSASCSDHAEERLAFLRASLKRTAYWSRVWYGTWLAGYAALNVGGAALIPVQTTTPDKIDMAINAGSALVGVVAMAITWPQAITESAELEKLVQAGGDLCATLQAAEAALSRAADWQIANTKWYMHVANAGFSVAVGLALGIALGHWLNGALNAVIGTGLGEATLFSMPTGSIKDREQYQRGEFGAQSVSAPTVTLFPMAGASRLGLGLRVTF